jgi:hypothetical protein
VYSAWIKHHFKEQPTQLLLESRTFIFDPLRPYGCGKIAQAHVSSRLVRALHDLGEAEYPVQTGKFRLPPYRIPWKYAELDRWSRYPSGGFRLIQFSRVAFNHDISQGLFAVSDSCGGLCGGGSALIAIREKGRVGFPVCGLLLGILTATDAQESSSKQALRLPPGASISENPTYQELNVWRFRTRALKPLSGSQDRRCSPRLPAEEVDRPLTDRNQCKKYVIRPVPAIAPVEPPV